jgi:hypothetical protein
MKKWVGIIGVIFIGVIVFFSLSSAKSILKQSSNKFVKSKGSSRFFCPLDGVVTSKSLASRHPIAIMVENSHRSRPQSGLESSCMVYETYVEGGVTRFMAIFVHRDAEVIGPIRSARQCFASWAKQFNAYYVHCWSKPSGREAIRRLKVASLNAIKIGLGSIFFRISSRPGPHNLYSSTQRLRELAYAKKIKKVAFRYRFKEDSPASKPTHPWIGVDFKGKGYFTHFEYNPKDNLYYRFLATKPHITGSALNPTPSKEILRGAPHLKSSAYQICPKNVVVLVMKISGIDSEGVITLKVTGKGKAFFFMDGKMKKGRWIREREGDITRYIDSEGKEIVFNRGQIWVQVIPSEKKLFLDPKAVPYLRNQN